MRNVLLSLFSAFFLLQAGTASAQIITQNGRDTATSNYSGSGSDMKVGNMIRSGSANPVVLRWFVIGHNLTPGSGWDLSASSGICDNTQCYTYDPKDSLFSGKRRIYSREYDNAAFNPTDNDYVLDHDFHIVFATNNPPAGSSAYVRVFMQDTVSKASRTLTFIATRNSLGVNTTTSSDDIVLYPNPAREAINVVYDPNAGVKTIAVFNLIGKLTGPIYKPAANGSAKISLEDMPSGVYFMRLMDANGRVIATRRFNHQ